MLSLGELIEEALQKLVSLNRLSIVDKSIVGSLVKKYAPLINENERNFLRSVKTDGGKLTSDRKKELGLKYNSVIGATLAEGLSCLQSVDDIFLFIARYIRGYQEWVSLPDKVKIFPFDLKIAVIAAEDSRTCEIARNLAGQAFDIHACPRLPLKGCDASYCRCVYTYSAV